MVTFAIVDHNENHLFIDNADENEINVKYGGDAEAYIRNKYEFSDEEPFSFRKVDYINKEHLLDAEKRDVRYLNYILCEDECDIHVERYFDHGGFFYVSLYTDKTAMNELHCVNRLNAEQAYDAIIKFFEWHRLK